ncbi:MAG TPA: hypothetical protein VJ972_09695 [Anaerolineales bacterium]|nr:hypothetical protein [Anaerolineales bacterium]
MNRKRETFEIMRGLGLLLVLWAAALMAVRLQLLFPRSMIEWLGESPNPQKALVAFGALVSSGIVGLLRLGIEVPPIKPLVASETVRTYITGIPLWVLGSIFAVSVGALIIVFPACQPPAFVNFKVQGRQETYRPNDTLMAVPDEFLAITAEPFQTDSILSCNWQYIGETFETIGSSSGCEIIVKLSGEPGVGLLTLQASQDFCNQSSVFSLNVQVTTP